MERQETRQEFNPYQRAKEIADTIQPRLRELIERGQPFSMAINAAAKAGSVTVKIEETIRL